MFHQPVCHVIGLACRDLSNPVLGIVVQAAMWAVAIFTHWTGQAFAPALWPAGIINLHSDIRVPRLAKARVIAQGLAQNTHGFSHMAIAPIVIPALNPVLDWDTIVLQSIGRDLNFHSL